MTTPSSNVGADASHKSVPEWAKVSERYVYEDTASEMLDALEKAAKVFRRYQALHRNKGTRDGERKAEANRQLAIELEAVITKAKGGAK